MYKATQNVVQDELEGEVGEVEELEGVDEDVVNESQAIEEISNAGRVIGILAGIASVIFGIIAIVSVANMNMKMKKAINYSQKRITDYYVSLVNSAVG